MIRYFLALGLAALAAVNLSNFLEYGHTIQLVATFVSGVSSLCLAVRAATDDY